MIFSENYYNFMEFIYKELQTIISAITESKVTELFCMADDFCKFFWWDDGVSYNRFAELAKEVAIPFALFIKKVFLGKDYSSKKFFQQCTACIRHTAESILNSRTHVMLTFKMPHSIEQNSPFHRDESAILACKMHYFGL